MFQKVIALDFRPTLLTDVLQKIFNEATSLAIFQYSWKSVSRGIS